MYAADSMNRVKLNVADVSRHAKPRLIFPARGSDPEIPNMLWKNRFDLKTCLLIHEVEKTHCPRDNREHRPRNTVSLQIECRLF